MIPGPLLEVRGLKTHLFTEYGTVRAVDGVDLTVNAGETVGIVGESGSGKTLLALSILSLLPSPPAEVVAGEIVFKGRDMLQLSQGELRKLRGAEIGTILQASATSLNPCLLVGDQIGEALGVRASPSKRRSIAELMRLVRISDPEVRVRQYPHQLSGGMKQRVGGAIALAGRPSLVIADEPTTALDATIQLQYLNLLAALQGDLGFALILITHDFGVVAKMCDQVAVMYAGRIVEAGPSAKLLSEPQHPYTKSLLRAVPRLLGNDRLLASIPGQPPDGLSAAVGCAFADRCPIVTHQCRDQDPPLVHLAADHVALCCNLQVASRG